MKNDSLTDTQNVGIIVPLPNHYTSDMPQGHGAVRTTKLGQLFFFEILKNHKRRPQTAG